MADRAITDYSAIVEALGADLLEIVDISEAAAADQNKKITLTVLFASPAFSTGIGSKIVCLDNAVLCIDNEVVTL